jgi:hypothetical protein
MAHYAFLDENNIVTEVITGVDENIIQTDLDGTQVGGSSEAWESFYSNRKGQVCKRTSYNNNYRKNYALIGSLYSEEFDVFIPPQIYNSWVLNEETFKWEPPIPMPTSGERYEWSESTLNWVEITD